MTATEFIFRFLGGSIIIAFISISVISAILYYQGRRTLVEVSNFEPKLLFFLQNKYPQAVHIDRICEEFPDVPRVVINMTIDALARRGTITNQEDGPMVYDFNGPWKAINGQYIGLANRS